MTYPATSDLKTYLSISSSSEDTFLGTLLDGAKNFCEQYTGRVFVSASSAKSFPVRRPYVTGRGLILSTFQEFTALTSITNGDGVAVNVTTELDKHPIDAPYYQIRLRIHAGKMFTDGGSSTPIAVTATWGYSASCPKAVFDAIVELAANMYRRRSTGAAGAAQFVGSQGIAVQPADVPATVMSVFDLFRRSRV